MDSFFGEPENDFFPFRDGRLAEFLFDSKNFFSDKMLAGKM